MLGQDRKRPAETTTTCSKKPRLSNDLSDEIEVVEEKSTPAPIEVEIEVHASQPPIDETETADNSTQTNDEWKPERLVTLLEAILSYVRRTTHAVEKMSSFAPPPPPLTAPTVSMPRRPDQGPSVNNNNRRDERRPWRRDHQ